MRMVDVGNLVRASDAGIVVITEVQPISVLFTLPQQELPDINRAVAQRALKVEAMETDSKNVLDTGTAGGHRQPGRPDHRHHPPQGGLPQQGSAALARPVRQRAAAARHAGAGRRRADLGRAARSGRHRSSMSSAPTTRRRCAPSEVAQQDEKLAVIAKGVAPSDVVVTTGFARLKDGAEVTVSPPADAKPAASSDAATPQASVAARAGRRYGIDQRRDAGEHAGRPAPRVPPGQARRRQARGRGGKRVTRPPPRNERLGPLHHAADRDLAPRLRHRHRRLRSAISGCPSRRCRRSTSRPSRSRRSCRAPTRRPCRRWSPPRWSASSGRSRRCRP